jgi:hypothetical protein
MEHGFICELFLNYNLSPPLWLGLEFSFNNDDDKNNNDNNFPVTNIYLYVMLQIMADKDMEDNDIVPAPKLIEVVFQNCRGQVDHWVEPYLRITVERLNRTQKTYLKCLFMQLVRALTISNNEIIRKLLLLLPGYDVLT